MKIIVGDQNNNDEQLTQAIIGAKDGDIIELLPGIYFSSTNPFICNIARNITLVGKTTNKNDVRLYCSFTISNQNIVIFKNLAISYTANEDNTLSAYDGARIYGDNISINRQTSDDWDTIYGKDAYFSFKDSQILTGKKVKAIGLSLENSQLFADNTSIQLLLQKHSRGYLKDSVIYHKFELRQTSKLDFRNLTIDATDSPTKNDLAVKGYSEMNGQDLIFVREDPAIRIVKSKFNVENFQPMTNEIHFKFDDVSKIVADGKVPFNEGPSDAKK
ncbi:hypothetical protein [Companilactobacillus nantensis]|uniref:DUF1565 domain-containing protein n=1 Tax=Companilactobacillus nantensis DSM 16982 TaxID=1423774 RepID=A0A0R1WJM4_9LACO|nr:hypothetical protein [Companilactobacillus nantensis]KRM17951.1 hypothetical protein FD31_GL002119 [Companilactobacillus nantensis DSM 16982]GEO63614.1 hypothetical protein LNA01_07970 [Companilactobacillus nantensis]